VTKTHAAVSRYVNSGQSSASKDWETKVGTDLEP